MHSTNTLQHIHDKLLPRTWSVQLRLFQNTHLPTIISSVSFAFLRINSQISIVKIVLLLLKTDVSDDIRAAIMTAIIRPVNNNDVEY